MAGDFYDRVRFFTTTTGTGTITVGSAYNTSWQTPAGAGIPNGATLNILITDGLNEEQSTGTYTSSGTTITRTLVRSSTGSLLNLSGAAVVQVVPVAADFVPAAGGTFTGAITLNVALGVGSGGSGTGTTFTAGSVLYAGASGIYSQDNSYLFYDSTNHKLIVGASAGLSIGGRLTVVHSSDNAGTFQTTGSNFPLVAWTTNASGDLIYFAYGAGATQVGSITTNGTSTAYNTSSDEQLKTFTGSYSAAAAAAIIRADPVRTFTWNQYTEEPGAAAVGWGAQTSYSVSSDLATPGVGAPTDDNYKAWGVDQSKRAPYLWAVIGAPGGLLDQVAALQAQVAALTPPGP